MTWIPFIYHDYFPKEAEKNLQSFSYAGNNFSPYYYYVMGPLSAFCVNNVISEKIAPNVLTLAGFVCALMGHTIMGLNCNDYDNPNFSVYALLSFSFLHFVYHVLDSADGK